MKIVKFSIKKRVTLTMFYLIVIGFALFAFSQLKVDLFPDIDFPVIGIITQYTGVGPEDIENLIARPVEETVSSTKNAKNIFSQISEGVCVTILEFDWGTDIDQAEIDVRKRIDFVRDDLPEDATDPIIFAFDPSMAPIMFMLLNSPYLGPAELRQLGEQKIEPLLERVDGVASSETTGGLERQVNVKLHPVLLAAHHLSPLDVVNAVQTQSGLFPAGTIETATTDFNLRIISEYDAIDQIKNTIIKYENENRIPLMVKDIAIVEDGYKELVGDVRANYNQSVFLRIFKQSDANTVLACKNVHKAMPVIKEVLPEGTELEIVYDQSNYILRSVSNLGNTAIIAFILTFLVIYFFLRNMRSSIIMGLSIPISVISTFAIMLLANLTLNIISIAGLALAIGMLVDNSIVVLENIYRLRETGFSAADSADTGASEVGMAITASTLTTIGVFLPVLFVPGIAGELFRDMVVTITFSLFASLVIALSLVPMLSSLIIKTESEFARKRLIKLKGSIANFLNKTVMKYSKLLHWSLGHKVKVIVYTFIVFVLTLVAAYLFIDMDFLPRHDQGFIALDVLRERGTPLNQTRLTVLELEKIVKEKVPEVTNVFATFGSTEGIAALFGGSGSHAINFRVRLTPVEERSRSQMEIESEMRKSLDNIPGISYQFRQQGGFSTERAVEVKIFGYNLTHSKIIAEQIKERMKRVPGLVDIDLNVKEGGDELRIIPDRKRLNDLKLNALQMANIVSIAMQGRTAALYREEGDEYNVVVRLDKPFRQSKEAIENLMIPIMPDKMIPLNQIARIEHSTAPTTIYRENQERYISVGCDLSDIALSEGVAEIKKIIQEISIPSEFQVVLGGTAEDQQESFFYLIIAFFAAVILVYMIMASQFESLVDPFIIMFTVPLAIIGVIIALLITGTVLSVMALVGLVMLAGIVVNNGIVMVDYINQLRRKGMELYEAVELGAKTRFRPVLMTAITTILGMVPLALELGSGSENWAPLARSVIGGLTTSTLLTLVIIPVVYILFEKLGERVKKILNW